MEQNKINCVRLYLQLGADITIKDKVSNIVANLPYILIIICVNYFNSFLFKVNRIDYLNHLNII